MPKFIISLALLLYPYSAKALSLDETFIYFPANSGKIDMIVLQSSPGKTSLVLNKIQLAMSKNQTWFQEYLKENSDKRPLPYHKNMGVSPEEYSYFISEAHNGKALVPKKIGQANVLIKREQNYYILIFLNKGEKLFSGNVTPNNTFKIDGLENLTSTPSRFNNPKSPFGNIEGFEWKIEHISNSDPLNFTGELGSVKVGKITGTDQCFLIVEQYKSKNGVTVLKGDSTFQYQCIQQKGKR